MSGSPQQQPNGGHSKTVERANKRHGRNLERLRQRLDGVTFYADRVGPGRVRSFFRFSQLGKLSTTGERAHVVIEFALELRMLKDVRCGLRRSKVKRLPKFLGNPM